MTVSTTTSTAQFDPNGVTINFPFAFRFFAATDLKVFWQKPDGTIQLLVLNSNYTVQGVGNDAGGSITTIGTPLPNGLLVVSRIMVATQLTSFRNQGEFFAEIHEDAFDKLVMLVQQTLDGQGRGLTVPVADPLDISLVLPGAVVRSDKLLAFDGDGQPVMSNLTLEQIEQQPALAMEAAEQAQAAAVAAGDSKDAAALSQVAAAASEALAQKWAENPEDTPVLPGQYSAHHWANKAAATILTAQKQIQEITASVAASALTLGWVKTPISFRSPTLTSGTINTRNPAANLSLVIPSGATLGTTNGVLAKLVLLLIDNAGTVELAVVNAAASGLNLDETNLISTSAISAGATSANVIYSAVARSNVPFRVAGVYDSTQATAGTWVTALKPQGQGGQNIIGAAKIVASGAQNTTSGASIDFTGIPPWVKKITVVLSSVSTNGASPLYLRLGTSTGIVSAGYLGGYFGSATVNVVNATISLGMLLEVSPAASHSFHSVIHIVNLGGNLWCFSGTIGEATTARSGFCTGSINLSGPLDRVRLTTQNGTDLFDAGSASIIYEG